MRFIQIIRIFDLQKTVFVYKNCFLNDNSTLVKLSFPFDYCTSKWKYVCLKFYYIKKIITLPLYNVINAKKMLIIHLW